MLHIFDILPDKYHVSLIHLGFLIQSRSHLKY